MTTFGYTLLGLIIGVFFGVLEEQILLGTIGGAVLGMMIARLVTLERRLHRLESEGRRYRSQRVESAEPAPTKKSEAPATTLHWSEREAPADPQITGSTSEPATATRAQPTDSSNEPWSQPAELNLPPEEGLLQGALKKLTGWFTHGNVPVKVGVIVSFIGVAFLLKYAVDKELIFLPLKFRLLGVALAGLALLVIGWRLRNKTRSYALSLQGGGIGILFLTIFAAFRIWALLPAMPAFVLLVVVTVATGVLAVVQNARHLAILGIVGGFLAPLLTSTGTGSHVALFSYYLVLNGAILGIALFRPWRDLNLIGFGFTFVIGSLWGYDFYTPELLSSTQPFLLLFFLFYQAIAILFAIRQPPSRFGVVDGALVFGTPTISFALQAALMQDTEYGLAISAAVLAAFYLLTAIALIRAKGVPLRLLTESFMALAVTFATLAIPLALDARWTAAAWALEGAALVWVGMRQSHHLANLAGTLLIFGSGVAFWEYGWKNGHGMPVINGNVLGGVLIALGALFSARKLGSYTRQAFGPLYQMAAFTLFVWGVTWWLGTGLLETLDRPTKFAESHTYLLFLVASMLLAMHLGGWFGWSMLRRTSSLLLPMLAVLGFHDFWADEHFLLGLGWLAWILAWAAQVWLLRDMDIHSDGSAGAWHFTAFILLTLMLANETWWQVTQVLSWAWADAAAATLAGLMALIIWECRTRPAWPVPQHPARYLDASILIVAAQVLFLTGLSLERPGNPDPLPYIPLFNPFDLALIFAGIIAAMSLSAIKRGERLDAASYGVALANPYRLMLAVAFFIMSTAALVRGVHHVTGVRWDFDTLFASVIVQSSLSIYWGILGFAGMLWGARSKRRPVWLVGTGFMALVVVKLFTVDLTQTGTIERIVSFIGIGALLLVVGYFAPVPPRAVDE